MDHMWQMLEPRIETRAAPPGGRLRLRPRGDGHHAQRQRGAGDRAARPRPRSRATRSSPPTRTTARMLTTWEQRVRRDGIMLDEDLVPGAATALDGPYRTLRAGASRRATKVIEFTHITNLTGQIFPVREICAHGPRARHRAPSSTARTPSRTSRSARDLDCDYYGTSLHKWLLAPDRHGLPLRAQRTGSPSTVAADGRAGARATTTSASTRRSARTRPRTTTPSPRPSPSTTASASSARWRACATCSDRAGPSG